MPEIISLVNHNNLSSETSSISVGQTGEKLAAEHLVKKSYLPVASNFKVSIGRNRVGAIVTGEIDLIAYDKDTLCFIEVKTRSSDKFASPLAAVDLRKQRQITRTARVYRKIFQLNNIKFRYDVVAIVLQTGKPPEIELLKGFWSENKFSKTFWSDDF
ncbi:MAG TPA: YraN family protein [Pyrinomonadaceae bacterium]|nr:YraN family protein [Pyrinomonadaceae bacterium]